MIWHSQIKLKNDFFTLVKDRQGALHPDIDDYAPLFTHHNSLDGKTVEPLDTLVRAVDGFMVGANELDECEYDFWTKYVVYADTGVGDKYCQAFDKKMYKLVSE